MRKLSIFLFVIVFLMLSFIPEISRSQKDSLQSTTMEELANMMFDSHMDLENILWRDRRPVLRAANNWDSIVFGESWDAMDKSYRQIEYRMMQEAADSFNLKLGQSDSILFAHGWNENAYRLLWDSLTIRERFIVLLARRNCK